MASESITLSEASNDTSIGSEAWLNPSNATASDNVYATTNATNTPAASNYLKLVAGAGSLFSLPNFSVVDGVVVSVAMKGVDDGGSFYGYVTDNSIRLVIENLRRKN